ncbi:MAG: EngA family GTP-binding protein, partial [Candidatus Falkowbacteria bacterium]|nr:EngA family GTP-binding protein [Candidatus Falkowbacteria bacterium]
MDKVTIKNNELYRVALFGRTNVGKSSLFNRLTGNSKAMVSNLAGTTRDANFGVVDWQGQKFELADTGGIIDLDKLFIKKVITNDIDVQVQRQIKSVLKKAHLILFVVDAKQGYNEEDKKVVLVLKKVFRDLNKIILVVNKADNAKDRMNATDFYKLAVGEPQMVSAHTGSGTGDLLEEVIKRLDYSL